MKGVKALVARLRARLAAVFAGARQRMPWLDHVVRAWGRYKGNSGDYLAGAITFFSFLALFPLILLGVSIASFVLNAHPDALNTLLNNVEKNAPGGLGDTIKSAINTAIKARTGVGIVGLVGTLFTGLGWVANLRLATSLVWGTGKLKRPFLKAKIADSIVLVGLGVGLLVSVALTAGGTAASQVLLKHSGLDSVPGSGFLAPLIGIVLALLADMVIFGFLLLRLPRATVPRGLGLRGALLAAVGFEILKVIGTFYLAKIGRSPAASALGSVLGVLVFLNLVFRYLMFCVAWIATGLDAYDSKPDLVAPPTPPATERTARAPSPAAVAGTLLGAGAAVGVGTVGAARWWWRRSRRRSKSVAAER